MNAPAPGSTVRFELTRDDYAALVGHLASADLRHAEARHENAARARWIYAAWIAQSALAGAGGYLLLTDRLQASAGMIIVVAIGFAMYSTSILIGAVRRLGSLSASNVLDAMIDEHACGRRLVSLTADGVRLRTAALDALNRWMAVERIDESESLVIIRARAPGYIIIPKRSFATPQACRDFIDTFNHMKNADQSGINLLAAYLAGRDVACLRCGYNLRDQRTARCPECGVIMELNALRRVYGPPSSLLLDGPGVEGGR